jgi:drug/metabolite transporter (DMT)-like permease
VLGGLLCYGLSALVWLRVLGELEVSKAYPFIAVGIVATMVLGVVILGETVTALRAAGAALIVAGVIVVGFS